jgi:hypothetical protein
MSGRVLDVIKAKWFVNLLDQKIISKQNCLSICSIKNLLFVNLLERTQEAEHKAALSC